MKTKFFVILLMFLSTTVFATENHVIKMSNDLFNCYFKYWDSFLQKEGFGNDIPCYVGRADGWDRNSDWGMTRYRGYTSMYYPGTNNTFPEYGIIDSLSLRVHIKNIHSNNINGDSVFIRDAQDYYINGAYISDEDMWNSIDDGIKYGGFIFSAYTSAGWINWKYYPGDILFESLEDSIRNGQNFELGFHTNVEEINNRCLEIDDIELKIYWHENPITVVNVQNRYSETNLGGYLSVSGVGGQIPSGTNLNLNVDSTYNVKTLNKKFTNPAVMHHHWNTDETQYKLAANIEVSRGTNFYAEFKDYKNVSFASSFSDEIFFKDPWYLNPITGQQDSPYQTFSSGSSYSVFLNQNEDFSLTKPIYRLKAPVIGQVTQRDIYVFDHWSVSPSDSADFQNPTARETAVVFKSAGATVTAHYVSANQEGKAVTIAAGESLTLPAGGSYTVANGNFGLVVKGTLNISGTADNPVTFAYADTNSNWGGIAVQAGGILNCEYANISRARTGILVNHGAEATIKNSVFTDCYPAIESRSGIVSIENCLFKQVHDMVNAGFVYMQIATNVEEDYKIFNNTFVNNPNRAGINIEFDDFPIQSSLTNPADNPVNLVNLPPSGSRVFIFNNIFSGLGTGIYFSDSELHGHHVYIQNDCFYGNETDITPLAGVLISDTLCRNPLFVNPSSDNYHLQSTSPCIDAGNPTAAGEYYTPYDPDYTIKDIGAYYYDHIPAAPYLVSVTWVSSHPRLLWNRVADQDIQKYRVYKTYVNSSGSRTTTVDVGLDTTYTDPEITYVNPRFANTTASYKVTALDNITQESAYSNTRSVSGNGPLWKAVAAMPTEFALHPAYPNPFNPVTCVRFDVPEQSLVSIVVYDLLGRRVRTLMERQFEPGYYEVVWDGKNDGGESLSAGLYFIKMHAPQYQRLEKCTLIK